MRSPGSLSPSRPRIGTYLITWKFGWAYHAAIAGSGHSGTAGRQLPVRAGPVPRRGTSVRGMNPLRIPRLWVRLASVVMLGFALWLLLVPRIALYYVDDGGAPYEVDAKYAWGRGTSDQVMVLPTDLFGKEDPAVGSGGVDGFVTSVRLNCGLVFTTGAHEADSPGGATACSAVETPRLIGGVGLGVLGIAGFVVAGRLPSTRDADKRG